MINVVGAIRIAMILISCIITGVMNYCFMETFFEKKYKSNYFVIFSLLTICKFLIATMNIIVLNYISTILYFLILSKYLYESEHYHIYMMTTIFMILLFISEAISIYFIGIIVAIFDLNGTVFTPIFLGIISLSLNLVLYTVIIFIFKHKVYQNTLSTYFDKTEMAILLIFTLMIIMFTIISNLIHDKEMMVAILCICVLILFSCLYVIVIFDKKINNQIINNKYALLKEVNIRYLEKYKLELKQFERERKIIHDIKNHLEIMEKLYLSNEVGKAKQYKEQITSELSNNIQVYSSNPILQILITELYESCEDEKIQFNYHIDKRVDLYFMSDFDIVTLFSNIIRNALEAVREIDNKEIVLNIRLVNDSIIINMSNPYKKINRVHNMYISTKKNDRGIGLMNVASVCKKYNGFLEISTENQEFNICIIMPIRKEG